MYVQCKVYIHLWRRLKAYNRVIYVQNLPETYKKLTLEKPPLVEPNLENKEALVTTQSDTNSSQYTETEEYCMDMLQVWPPIRGQLWLFLCTWKQNRRHYGRPGWLRRRWMLFSEHLYLLPQKRTDGPSLSSVQSPAVPPSIWTATTSMFQDWTFFSFFGESRTPPTHAHNHLDVLLWMSRTGRRSLWVCWTCLFLPPLSFRWTCSGSGWASYLGFDQALIWTFIEKHF